MSVRTTADAHLESAKEHIDAAIVDLDEILIRRCWGYDEFTPAYTAALEAAFAQLRALQTALNP